jgi:hypothetical protein
VCCPVLQTAPSVVSTPATAPASSESRACMTMAVRGGRLTP